MRILLGRDQRHAQADVHDAVEHPCRSIKPVTIEPMKAFPHVRGSGDGRIVELTR